MCRGTGLGKCSNYIRTMTAVPIYKYHEKQILLKSRIQKGARCLDLPPTHTLKNHKNIGFLGNTGTNPLTVHKATKSAFNVGHHWYASETPNRWRGDDGPLLVVFGSSLPSLATN